MWSAQTYNGLLAGSSPNVLRLSTVRPWNRPSLSTLPTLEASALKTERSEAYVQRNNQRHATKGTRTPPVSVTTSDSRPADPSHDLNKEQLEAVITSSLTVRVKAGPGSGKTRVVVARAGHLITRRGEDPANILAITFTNKAANELKERLEAAAGGGPSVAAAPAGGNADGGVRSEVLAKTFHGLAVYLLRRTLPRTVHAKYGVDRGFKIVDQDRSQYLIYEAVKQVLEAQDAAAAAEKLEEKDLKVLAVSHAKLLSECIAYVKRWTAAGGHHDERTAVAVVVKHLKSHQHEVKGLLRKLGGGQAQEYYCAYQALLRENNALDFDDLICLSVRTLDEDEELRSWWQARFRHILVDEFQDIDSAQYRLVKLLRGASCGLFVVGDPDQAIYGWRGAEVAIMGETLEKDFPDIQTHILKVNYRSVPAIIHAADAVLTAPGRPALYIQPVAARKPEPKNGVPINCQRYNNPTQEAQSIAELIRSWVPPSGLLSSVGRVGTGRAGQQLRLSEIAVLYRNRNLSRPLEEAFVRAGLPYVVIGGQPFWQYKEIQDVVAYLHVLLEPQRSDVFLQRIINEPKRGLGDKALVKLHKAAAAAGLTLGGLLFGDCCDVGPSARAGGMMAAGDVAAFAPAFADNNPLRSMKLSKTALGGIQDLRGLVAYLRAQAAANKPVAELMDLVLNLSGYLEALHKQEKEGAGKKQSAKSKKDEQQVAQERLDRLVELHDSAASPETWYFPDGDDDGNDEDTEEGENFVLGPAAGLQRGLGGQGRAATKAPRSGSRGLAGLAAFLEHAALVADPEKTADGQLEAVRLMTLHASKGLEFERVFIVGLEEGILPSKRKDKDLDEERRLLYVGLTRAKTRLHLSHCQIRTLYGREEKLQISSFLNPHVLGHT